MKLKTSKMKKRGKNPVNDLDTIEQKQRLHKEKQVSDNSDSSDEFLGRSPTSWIKLILYSVTFDACNAVFWGLCLWAFYQTLDNYEPRLQVTSTLSRYH